MSKITLISLLISSVISTCICSSLPCPDYCNCYVDLSDFQTASCYKLVWNGTYFPNVEQLQVRLAPYAEQCRLPNIPSKIFPNLQKLDLSNCSLTSVPPVSLNHFISVRELDLSHNHIREISSTSFLLYRKLQYVNLKNNPLDSQSPLILESTSIYEINLDSCHIQNITRDMFVGLPNLKYLTISNNNISTLYENSLPDGLRTIDLSKNKIVNVPTDELIRLRNLREVNLYANPINCTCGLMGFQNWVSGKGVIFVNVITCAYPHQYTGCKLNDIPQYDICDAKVIEDTSSTEQCAPNQICSNGIVTNEDFLNDQPIDENRIALEKDEVILANTSLEVIEDTGHLLLEGSGDGDSTDAPESSKDVTSTSNNIQSSTGSTSIHFSAQPDLSKTTYTLSSGVMKVENELSSTFKSSQKSIETDALSNKNEIVSSVSSTPSSRLTKEAARVNNETSQNPTASEKIVSGSNSTNLQLQERLQDDRGRNEMFGYLIPGLVVLLVGVVCLIVYCGQCASKMEMYKPSDTNVEGAELQEVSLLSDRTEVTVVKQTNKYSEDGENDQTERLIDDHDQTNRNNIVEINVNGNEHSDDTINCCKLANSESANRNTFENVERRLVKIISLPDSIPKTTIIRSV